MKGVELSVVSVYCMLVLCLDSVAGIKHDLVSSGHQESKAVKQDTLQKIVSMPFGCPPLPPKRNLATVCKGSMIKNMSCSLRVPLGTKVTFKCADTYVVVQKYKSITCAFPGRWSKPAVSCKPKPTSSSTEVSTESEASTVSEDTTTSEESTSAETTAVETTAVETTAATSTESVATTATATTTTTTPSTTTTPPTTSTTTATTTTATTTTAIPTTTLPPGYQTLPGVGMVKIGYPNTLVNAIADCATIGATVMAVSSQAKLDYIKKVVANASTFIGSVNQNDIWAGVEKKNNIWQTLKGVSLAGNTFFVFGGGGGMVSPLAVYSKPLQGHWDIPAANGFTSILPYICEK